MANPNIVLIVADDQRWNTIQALGAEQILTPNLNALTEGGTAFLNAHIPGGTCGAVCMPSRAMLHTGRRLFHLADDGEYIPDEHTLLGEHLQRAGYASYGTGKWHNGHRAFARSFTAGAEIFFGGMWDHWNVPAYSYDSTGKYDKRVPYISDPFHSRAVDFLRSDHISPGRHSTDLFADAAVDWIDGYGESEPFFLNLNFMAPHDPRSMPKEYLDLYDPAALELPVSYLPEHPFDYGIRTLRDEVLAPYPRQEETVRQHLAEYYAMITHLDAAVGRVLEALERNGYGEDTLVVFTGDNGLALGSHGLFGKQNGYEHSLRVPLIMKGPGLPAGERREQACYLFDLFPTLCDLLGVPVPATVEGRSLRNVLESGETVAPRESMYFAYEDKLRAVKRGSYKLIAYGEEGAGRTQLFDLAGDPDELNDLAGTRPELEASLMRELRRLGDEWDDCSHPAGRRFWDYRS